MSPDSSPIIEIFSIKLSLSELIGILVLLTGILGTIFGYIRRKKENKPEIIKIVSSINGSKVTITIFNKSKRPIKVEKLYLRKHKFLFVWSSQIVVDNQRVPENAYVTIFPNESRSSSYFPPDTVWFSRYKIYAKTSGGTCSILYEPKKVEGLSPQLLSQHKSQ